ncbi:unnamed protein product, partial [Heligmosomoides polygyrus]|uniref:Type VI secretion system protein ImpB n=1 Tax=Heligmosomoides polygyrus TaxID=6339 RepID=A0A183GKG3_HELPZ
MLYAITPPAPFDRIDITGQLIVSADLSHEDRPAKRRLQLTSPSDEKKSLVDAVALLSSDDGLPVHLKTIIGHLLERATLADELIQRN